MTVKVDVELGRNPNLEGKKCTSVVSVAENALRLNPNYPSLAIFDVSGMLAVVVCLNLGTA